MAPRGPSAGHCHRRCSSSQGEQAPFPLKDPSLNPHNPCIFPQFPSSFSTSTFHHRKSSSSFRNTTPAQVQAIRHSFAAVFSEMRSPTARPNYDLVLSEFVVIFFLGALLFFFFFSIYAFGRMYEELHDDEEEAQHED